MPDQSQSNESVSGKTDQQTGNPADTSANTAQAASAESQESNVTRASQGQQAQAAQTIEGDPTVTDDDATVVADDYDDEEAWPYRKLQAHAKEATGDGSGKREEIVARLRAQASEGTVTPDVPRASVDPTNVENGGIRKTSVAADHAGILQGLSNERRAAQLAVVQERSERSGE